MAFEDFRLLGAAVGHVRGARPSVCSSGARRFLDHDPPTVEPRKELTASLPLIQTPLPMAAEMLNDGIREYENLPRGSNRVLDHAAGASLDFHATQCS